MCGLDIKMEAVPRAVQLQEYFAIHSIDQDIILQPISD